MRVLIVVVLAGLALWQGWADWQATIGHGYAWRFTPVGQVLADAWPDGHARLVSGWQDSGPAWNPVGRTLLALPVAPLLGILAFAIWMTRRRRR